MEKTINNITLTTAFTHKDIQHSIAKHIEIFDSEYGFSPYFNKKVSALIQDFETNFNAETDFMLIAKKENKFAGTITAIGKENGKVQLRFFFVEPFARGEGVGKLLFVNAMEYAKQKGYTHAFFSTYSVLKVARTMYHQLGFTITQSSPAPEIGTEVIEEIWERDL